MTPPIIYKICLDDIEKSWKFALEYYLDESKPIKDRTNFQKRGLGGIIDSFLNKIIEIAVCKKLHEINPKKIFETDFDIHPLTKKKTEPDIINIVEKNRKSSEPKIYVEIKNSADADDWFGPKASELESIKKNVFEIDSTKKMYYIYCEIKDRHGQSRKSSPLGVWLKHKLKQDPNLKKFHNVKDLFVQFNYVFTVEDIDDFGTTLEKGTPLPDTDVFPEVKERTKKQIRKKIGENSLDKINLTNGLLPKITASRLSKRKWLPYPNALGNFKFKGKIEAYVEKHSTVRNCWLKCLTDVTVSNDVLGKPCGFFQKDDVVKFVVKQKGEITKKNSTDRFVAKCNQQITNKFKPCRLNEIAKSI